MCWVVGSSNSLVPPRGSRQSKRKSGSSSGTRSTTAGFYLLHVPRFLASPKPTPNMRSKRSYVYGFNVIVVQATSDAVDCSEFGFGDNERVRSGKVFRRRVHEFVHTVLSCLSHRETMRDNRTHISWAVLTSLMDAATLPISPASRVNYVTHRSG